MRGPDAVTGKSVGQWLLRFIPFLTCQDFRQAVSSRQRAAGHCLNQQSVSFLAGGERQFPNLMQGFAMKRQNCDRQLESICVLCSVRMDRIRMRLWKEGRDQSKTNYGCKFWWGFILTDAPSPIRIWLSLANWLFPCPVAWHTAVGLM